MRGFVDGPDVFEAIYDAVRAEGFEEVIVSTMLRRFSRWVEADLPARSPAWACG